MAEEVKISLSEVSDNSLVETLVDLKHKANTYKYPKAVLTAMEAYKVNKRYAVNEYKKRIEVLYRHRELSHGN